MSEQLTESDATDSDVIESDRPKLPLYALPSDIYPADVDADFFSGFDVHHLIREYVANLQFPYDVAIVFSEQPEILGEELFDAWPDFLPSPDDEDSLIYLSTCDLDALFKRCTSQELIAIYLHLLHKRFPHPYPAFKTAHAEHLASLEGVERIEADMMYTSDLERHRLSSDYWRYTERLNGIFLRLFDDIIDVVRVQIDRIRDYFIARIAGVVQGPIHATFQLPFWPEHPPPNKVWEMVSRCFPWEEDLCHYWVYKRSRFAVSYRDNLPHHPNLNWEKYMGGPFFLAPNMHTYPTLSAANLGREDAVKCLADAMMGCIMVHEDGLVHHDIKSTNILVLTSPEGSLFGRLVDRDTIAETGEGSGANTPGYCPWHYYPRLHEQYTQDDISTTHAAVDVFAFGISLLEQYVDLPALQRAWVPLAFDQDRTFEESEAECRVLLIDTMEDAEIPEAVQQILLRMLHPDAARRPRLRECIEILGEEYNFTIVKKQPEGYEEAVEVIEWEDQ